MVSIKHIILPGKIGTFDFEWVFEKNTELTVTDPKYKSLLMNMYKHSTTPFLILKDDEEYLLQKYKLIRNERVKP
jgi:hypothetical protein